MFIRSFIQLSVGANYQMRRIKRKRERGRERQTVCVYVRADGLSSVGGVAISRDSKGGERDHGYLCVHMSVCVCVCCAQMKWRGETNRVALISHQWDALRGIRGRDKGKGKGQGQGQQASSTNVVATHPLAAWDMSIAVARVQVPSLGIPASSTPPWH